MKGEIKIPENCGPSDGSTTITVGETQFFVSVRLWYGMLNEAYGVGFDMTLVEDC